jgi:hypothetical protein
MWGLASSIFYKRIHNVVDFRDNARLFLNKYIESQLLQGSAQAYGAELFIEKKKGRLTGSLSYTLSKTYNQIEGVNDGNPYPNRYDKRHNISSMWRFQLNPKLNVSANFILTSGGALTVPTGTFVFDGIPFNYYSKRNGYRLPVYNRLDLAFKYQRNKNPDRKFKGYWVLDIYNVYGKKNPFTVYSLQTDYGFQATKVNAFYLFKIVPSISYNFTF